LRSPAFTRRSYAVLANLSAGYSPPLGRFRSITHPFAARQHVLLHLLPLDLHVLGTPPAFNLSQDQTLHLKNLKHRNEWPKKTHCWTFLVTRSNAPRHRRESPHKLPAKFLKSIRRRGGGRKMSRVTFWTRGWHIRPSWASVPERRGRKYSQRRTYVNYRPQPPAEHCAVTDRARVPRFPQRTSAEVARGAQYSGRRDLVKRLS
jgi:hypothetical protein